MANKAILFISDLHTPAHHKDLIPFLKALKKKYKPDRIVFSGDEIDGHAIHFHEVNPDYGYSPSTELKESIKVIKELNKIFPKADLLDSNHGSLVYRRARAGGIPSLCLKKWSHILGTTHWKWHSVLTIKMSNGKLLSFHHGKSSAFLKWANAKGHSTAEGHYHTKFGCVWSGDRFSLKAGCLIDNEKLNFLYNKNNADDVIIGCAIILNGVPKMLPMGMKLDGSWDWIVP